MEILNSDSIKKILESIKRIEEIIIALYLSNILRLHVRYAIALVIATLISLVLLLQKSLPTNLVRILSVSTWICAIAYMIVSGFSEYKYYAALISGLTGMKIEIKTKTVGFLALAIIGSSLIIAFLTSVIRLLFNIPLNSPYIVYPMAISITFAIYLLLIAINYALNPIGFRSSLRISSMLVILIPIFTILLILKASPIIPWILLPITTIAIILVLGYDLQNRARLWLKEKLTRSS